MPRNGSGVYSAPAGTTATPNTTIESSKYNAFVSDLVNDANAARPVTAGGTGAASASDARTNLGLGGFTPASASGPASLQFAEDTDNGSNKVTLIAPSSVASDKTATLQDKTGTVALLEGSATNDSASSGQVGEYIESIVATGASVSLSTGTAATVTSISLTAGDWDVSGRVTFNSASGTSITAAVSSISRTNNTNGIEPGGTQLLREPGGYLPGANPFDTGPVGPVRISLASTTTIYLVAQAAFTVSTLTAFGLLRARRMR